MSFFAVLFALLIEQVRPLGRRNAVHDGIRHWAQWVRQAFNAGQSRHGVVIWALAVGLPVLVASLVHWLLSAYSLLLTLAWAVAVLYVTWGFRQFSHHFTAIRTALETGDMPAARSALAEWQGVPIDSVSEADLVSQAISCSVKAVHRHVLGVLVCFVALWMLGLGPAGAVLFRLADHMARSSCTQGQNGLMVLTAPLHADVCTVARRMWRWINHLPARATALTFAVVGNFEEAVANWRQESDVAEDANDAIVLAAAAGAMNVKWGEALDSGLSTPQLAHLTSLVGLVWRSVVLWMLFLALVMLTRSVGP